MKEKKIIKGLFIALSIVLLASVASLFAIMASNAKKKTKVVFRDSEATAEQSDEICNVLFLGTDREAGLCDVVMLVNVNFSDETATVAQIPRDTYARYTESSYKKLNGAYKALGGAKQTAEFLADAFCIDIHHYICIDLDTLSDVVDAVGGVDVDLPFDMKYRDPEQGLYIDLREGMTHLDGELAEQFVRFRSGYADGDLGRIDAQKLFMAAFFEKIANEFSPVMAARLTAAADGVETDIKISDILAIGARVIDMEANSISMMTLAGAEAIASKSGASYFVLSAASCTEIMERYFGGSGEFDPNKLFLNENYDEFEEIYEGYSEYSVTPMKGLLSYEQTKNRGKSFKR